MRTVKIDGKEYAYLGLSQDCSTINLKGRDFVMFPAVRSDGDQLELPQIGPYEIRQITTMPPDLTGQHHREIKEMFEERKEYYSNANYDEHLKHLSRDAWISKDEFEDERQRVLTETFSQFSKSKPVREAIWLKYYDPEKAEEIGLLSTEVRVSLQLKFMQQGMTARVAWEQLDFLKWVALYDDPAKTKIYLYDLKPKITANWALEQGGAGKSNIRVRQGGKKRGRKVEYNSKADKRVLAGWEQGHFRTYDEYAREKGVKCSHVYKAIKRARARRRYLKMSG
jgi:hypothetical protein